MIEMKIDCIKEITRKDSLSLDDEKVKIMSQSPFEQLWIVPENSNATHSMEKN